MNFIFFPIQNKYEMNMVGRATSSIGNTVQPEKGNNL